MTETTEEAIDHAAAYVLFYERRDSGTHERHESGTQDPPTADVESFPPPVASPASLEPLPPEETPFASGSPTVSQASNESSDI